LPIGVPERELGGSARKLRFFAASTEIMARSLIAEKLHQLRYFYRGTGVTGVVLQIARHLLAPLYHREVQYILIQNIERQAAADPVNGEGESPGTECLLLESSEALGALAGEIPSSFRYSVADLKEYLEQGCLVFLARKPKDTGSGKEVVGYNISQRGVFSAFGRTRWVSSDILFAHYTEVLPEYRGRKIQQVLVRARIEYCQIHGVKKRCTAVGTENQPSIVAGMRVAPTVVGPIERVSVLGGFFVWETPWERIEEALRQ
jgi:GNAT superfamily N-acetyltransferase